MQEQTHTIDTADGPMGVRIVRPDGDGPFPVIVYFHHGPGLTPESKESMRWIADWGYYLISPDRYHRKEAWYVADGEALAEDESARRRLFALIADTTEQMVASDLDAVLAYVADDPTARDAPYGCVGFCIGARSVLRTLQDRNDIFRVGVGMHPSNCTTDDVDSPHLAVANLEGSLYLSFGSEDRMQSPEANRRLIDAVKAKGDGFEVEIHEGADHGFGVPGRSYHEAAATRSYERAKALFARELG
jgi:carboxymethylenebutenolidase